MTPTQFKSAIEELGLGQEGAGLFFGYSGRTGQRWASGKMPVPLPVEWCLRLMLKHEIEPGEMAKYVKG